MEFPIYAKHPDHSVWYEILSAHHFNEKKRLGPSKYPLQDYYVHSEVNALDYSTALYIQDLLDAISRKELIQVSAQEFHALGNPNLQA